METKVETLEARIAVLEAKLAGQTAGDEIRCKRLMIVDSEDRERVEIGGFTDGTVGMVCRDESGNNRVEVHTGAEHQAELIVRGASGKGKGCVAIQSTSNATPSCSAFDAEGTLRVKIGETIGSVMRGGQTRTGIVTHGVSHYDLNGTFRGASGTNSIGDCYGMLQDTNGFSRINAIVTGNGGVTLPVSDSLS